MSEPGGLRGSDARTGVAPSVVMREVDLLGSTVNVEWHEAGEGGPPLLFLHGLHGFSGNEPAYHALAQRRRVIAPLHPGYGTSDRPDWLDSVGDLAHYYLDLLEELDLQDTTLVGSSLGGWIATEMVTRRPARIGRLVLVDALGVRVGAPTDRDVADIFAITRERVNELMLHDPSNAPPPTTEMSTETLERRMRAEESNAMYGWKPYMHNPKLRRRLHAVSIPTLTIWGQADGIVDVEYGRAYARAFPHADFEVIQGAGHYPHLEQPDQFVSVVEAFIQASYEEREKP
jgi:pimeloyl-ACP methyl ester carboxylesterase